MDGETEGVNYRYLILRALKQNLEAITITNGFRAEIKGVRFGGSESQIQNGEILIYSARDASVKNNQGETAGQSNLFNFSSIKMRNMHVKFRLLVKDEICSEITDDMVELRENYADAIIKGLYGRYAPARQLHSLLLDGISSSSGFAAFDILQFKEYGFSGRLELEAELLFTYKDF